MNENKQKLHEMIDAIQDSGVAAYLETFVRRWLETWGGLEPETKEGDA